MTPQEKARILRPIIEKAAASLSDEDALEAVELFPHYIIGHDYVVNERFVWEQNGKLYKVLQNHTSADEWTPDTAVSLYVEVTPPGVIPEWKQPVGSADAYMKDDKVRHIEKVWISLIDNNVWEPGVYGWEEVK